MASDRPKELLSHLARIDAALDASEPNGIAVLLRERRITLAELSDLEGVEKGSTVDELANRRSDRRTAAGVESPAG
ncbi:MAG: hypothetical protein ABIO83_05730 [Ilumatobacteraceae bacterium]